MALVTRPIRVNDDIIEEIASYFQETQLETTFPLWWVQFDMKLRDSIWHLASLALVARSWVIPTRRILLRVVPLTLSDNQTLNS